MMSLKCCGKVEIWDCKPVKNEENKDSLILASNKDGGLKATMGVYHTSSHSETVRMIFQQRPLESPGRRPS